MCQLLLPIVLEQMLSRTLLACHKCEYHPLHVLKSSILTSVTCIDPPVLAGGTLDCRKFDDDYQHVTLRDNEHRIGV